MYVYFIYAHTFVYICVDVYCIFKYKCCGIIDKYSWRDMLISILLEAEFSSSRFKVVYGRRVITAQVHLPSICSKRFVVDIESEQRSFLPFCLFYSSLL